MALATTVQDDLGIVEATFMPEWGQETANQGSGIVRTKDLRPPLWRARVSSKPFLADDMAGIEADLNSLEGSRYSMYLYNPRRPYPQSDPDGSILGGATVLIHTVVDSYNLRLKGLPAGYVLTKGDYLSFDYGSPGNRSLHQMMDSVTADGSGNTAAFGVIPYMNANAAADLPVTLVKPSAEMRMILGSLRMPTDGLFTTIQFDMRQVL